MGIYVYGCVNKFFKIRLIVELKIGFLNRVLVLIIIFSGLKCYL